MDKEELFENLKVVKRSGKKVDFDATKIAIAIKKGFDNIVVSDEDVEIGSYTEKDMQKVFQAVMNRIAKEYKDEDKIKIVKYLSTFSNCGFMGLPFLQSLFTDASLQSELMIYCAVIIAVFNVLNWTFGVYILTGDKKQISFKKVIINPVIIAVIISLVLFFSAQKPLVELYPDGTIANKIFSKLIIF